MQKNNAIIILLACLILIFSFSCKRKNTPISIIPEALKNHLQRARLFENVKSVETLTYYYSDQDSIFVFYNKNIQYYNSEGYFIEELNLDKNNDTLSKKTLYFLPNANENYWLENNYKEGSIVKDSFIYDKNGFKSEEHFLLNYSLLYRIQYKTDAIGSIIEMKRFLPKYQLVNKIDYNAQGLVERIEEFDPENKLYKFITIEYDQYGDELNRRVFDNANRLIEYTYTQYNKESALQKIIYSDELSNMREDKIYARHDAARNWLEEITMQGRDTLRKRVRTIAYY